MRRQGSAILLCAASALFVCGTAVAQEAEEPLTRAEALRLQREAKAAELEPSEESGLERGLLWLENDRFFERVLNPAQGVYPVVGSVTTGGGFALGPGYRRPGVLGGAWNLRVEAAGTARRYWVARARLTALDLADGRVAVDLGVERTDFPSEEFFGLGQDSERDDLVSYGLQNFVVGGGIAVQPVARVRLGGTLEWLTPRVSGGAEGQSIQLRFDEPTAPGLTAHANFVRTTMSAEYNSRQPLGNPRRGGRYAVAWTHYDDRTLDAFSFSQVDVDLQQYVPLLSQRRVLALRLKATSSDVAHGQRVPFYLQPTLGGPDDLRGFRRFRFRDHDLLLLQLEYRWEIFSAVDGALFYDAGKVAPRLEDLDLRDLESDYGIGVRFGTVNGIFLRIEGAFGSRGGKHLVLRYGHVF